jgi:hypothetical protein
MTHWAESRPLVIHTFGGCKSASDSGTHVIRLKKISLLQRVPPSRIECAECEQLHGREFGDLRVTDEPRQ